MLVTNAKIEVLFQRLYAPSQSPQPSQPVLAYVRDGSAGMSEGRSLLRAHASIFSLGLKAASPYKFARFLETQKLPFSRSNCVGAEPVATRYPA